MVVASGTLLTFLPQVIASDADFAKNEVTSYAADQVTSLLAEIPHNNISTRSPLLMRRGTSGELLRAVYTTTVTNGTVAKKTKTFSDKQLGVTLRYPGTVKYRVGKSTDKKLVQADGSFRMYEFVNRDSGATLGYSMVSTPVGQFFWSILTEVNREGIAEFAAEGLKMKDKTLALQAGYASTTYAGYVLHNDFVSYNDAVVMGVYTGSVKLPGGVFMGVAVFYSSFPAMNKAQGLLTAQQAQEMVATLLSKSKFDTKKIQKHFSVE